MVNNSAEVTQLQGRLSRSQSQLVEIDKSLHVKDGETILNPLQRSPMPAMAPLKERLCALHRHQLLKA